ncbi:MAG TPA: PKD domain-containing protein [Intrasporangium sp.]|uniref:PKD domain-containing protein n=1 Tax=Intrasporangium sp. TaxID=1925024 RepID=UPI002D77927C|nr:PKD domain-containing protein [Intrasporangium sp.]HET7399308.1 PKD domain-containing protein [Intrasporangium sp.]
MRGRATVAAVAAAALLAGLPGLLGSGGSGPATAEAAVAVPGEVHFTAAGDYANSPQTQLVLDKVAETAPDLNLALGDLSYGVTGQESAWCDLVVSKVGAGFPFELIAGSHESGGMNGNINDFSACLPNQLPGLVGTYGRQWYADVPETNPLVRFIGISPDLTFPDGTWSYAAGTARYAWTANAIDAARAKGVRWVVVGLHKPCISVGQYTCGGNTDITNLLVDKRVDLVLNGHEHLYQRTHQLRLGAACPGIVPGTFDPDCVADGDATMMRGAGTVFATVGTGGVALRDASPADPEAPYFATYAGLNQGGPFGVLSLSATASSLSAQFLPVGTSTFTDSFVLRDPLPGEDQPPTAVFSASCTDLACAFDASASSDAEGPVQGYSWDFGDGSAPGTGVTVAHTFPAAGTYTVTLTVQDSAGASGVSSRPVTVTVPPPAPTALAADSFGRTVAGGWGSADVGGPWTLTGTSSAFAVDGSLGVVRLTAGSGPSAVLKQVSTTTAAVTATIGLDKVPTGGTAVVSVLGRWVPSVGTYRAKVSVAASGAVSVALTRFSGGVEATLQPAVALPGVVYSPNTRLAVRMEVAGTSPTTLRAKVWPQGSPEPAAWTRSATDSTASLQTAGAVGVAPYLPTTVTNAPVAVSLDDLLVPRP